jgi:hypothetical protein
MEYAAMKTILETQAQNFIECHARRGVGFECRCRFPWRGKWGEWRQWDGIVPAMKVGERFEVRAIDQPAHERDAAAPWPE